VRGGERVCVCASKCQMVVFKGDDTGCRRHRYEVCLLYRRQATQHNDTLHNDTQHNGLQCDTPHNVIAFFYCIAECRRVHCYFERRYAECCSAECRYAGCHGAVVYDRPIKMIVIKSEIDRHLKISLFKQVKNRLDKVRQD
jgi:hypothetical protein